VRDVVSRDQDSRHWQASRREPPESQHAGRGGDYCPALRWEGVQKGFRSLDGDDALDILDLGQRQDVGFALGIHAGDVQSADGLDCPHSVHRSQDGFGIEVVRRGPTAPDAIGRGDAVDYRAVHIEQEGGERAADRGGGRNLGGGQVGVAQFPLEETAQVIDQYCINDCRRYME
jgi:hypothetical protein